jgi:hypothetical protein
MEERARGEEGAGRMGWYGAGGWPGWAGGWYGWAAGWYGWGHGVGSGVGVSGLGRGWGAWG